MKKQLREPMIQANRSKNNEVLGIISEFPQLEIGKDLQIKESNAHCYVLLALRSSHNAMTGKNTWSKQKFTKTEEAWNSLKDGDKTPQRMASAQRMVILHNPTIEEEEPVKRTSSEPVELSKAQKEDIEELHKGGADLKDIAKQLNLRQKDVQPHIETLV